MNGNPRTWRVGELATSTGLSVRALHHYDEIGLLRTTQRTSSGHRLYGEADVRRLHRILALRGFGLSLAEVAEVLDGELADPVGLIRRQLSQVQDQLRAATRLERGLAGVLDGLEQEHEPSVDKLIELMEGMTAMVRSLTVDEYLVLVASRERATAEMTEEEKATANEAREQWREGLSEEEFLELADKRRAMMPDGL